MTDAVLRIFVCYRREDSRYAARALAQAIDHGLSDSELFMDVDRRAIALGENWKQRIESAIDASDVVLALMGDRWLESADSGGRRRLDNPDDPVRLELEQAMKLDLLVIPVSLDEASMPGASELPESLADLVFRQGVELRHSRWDADVETLLSSLDALRLDLLEKRADRFRDEREASQRAAERTEAERLVREQAERAEAARLAKEQAERAEAERLVREQAERDEAERAEAERLVREQAERDEAERAEATRLPRKRAEAKGGAERLAREQAMPKRRKTRAAGVRGILPRRTWTRVAAIVAAVSVVSAVLVGLVLAGGGGHGGIPPAGNTVNLTPMPSATSAGTAQLDRDSWEGIGYLNVSVDVAGDRSDRFDILLFNNIDDVKTFTDLPVGTKRLAKALKPTPPSYDSDPDTWGSFSQDVDVRGYKDGELSQIFRDFKYVGVARKPGDGRERRLELYKQTSQLTLPDSPLDVREATPAAKSARL